MSEKLVVGPFNQGLRLEREPFVIDNDSFPVLINAYQWRGRVKRKRGTSALNRLIRVYFSALQNYNSTNILVTLANDGMGNGICNVFSSYNLQANASIIPTTFGLTCNAVLYTDPGTGTLNGNPLATINYATGDLFVTGASGLPIQITMFYYPNLPVMGLEDFVPDPSAYPQCSAFDTVYSYNIPTISPYQPYVTSWYKNPVTAAYTGYTQKTITTPTTWNGADYQQTWTTNYCGALWTTNGINVPFNSSSIGMQFVLITNINTVVAGPPASCRIFATGIGNTLVIGDYVFINEVVGLTGINFQTGYVTGVPGANSVNVTFPNATLGGAWASGGIVQYLTNRSDTTKDCLRWYDGDPTDGSGNGSVPLIPTGLGWVNFAPPLSQSTFSISNNPPLQYYLVGARMIVPFKDRLLFVGPVIQTSTGTPIYLQDTVIYSQNGTPYYTCSFTGSPTAATTVFNPILVPTNQTATASAYFEDSTGFGGFLSAGVDQAINTCEPNQDVLIMGFDSLQTRFVYSGNDLQPFNFFIVNSEYGSSSTFSAINTNDGVLSRGSRGFVLSNQTSSSRFDLQIPDQVFEINLSSNGKERICAKRDFINEWIYITYPSENLQSYTFPNQSLLYNYRDNSWAVFNESYTTYGLYRKKTGFTWATLPYTSWNSWNTPWSAGSSEVLEPDVIAGNQQGFVVVRDDSTTGEANSLYIKNISGSIITSPGHCLLNGDFIYISGCIGTISPSINGKIFFVEIVDANSFIINPGIGSGTYLGGGVIQRMYVPFIQTKQFPLAWGAGRKTRIGPQRYLLTTTDDSEIQLLIFLSQDAINPYNIGGVVPDLTTLNEALVYSTVLYTCPESTNLGLTPANSNLQMPTASSQQQIWHRVNTSLIGDTVQLGFTMSDQQMMNFSSINQPNATITAATNAYPCVLTCSNTFSVGQNVLISGVIGMTQLNGNIYNIITTSTSSISIDVDSTAFGTYVSDGIAQIVSPIDQFAEIELHGFILDASPSMELA